MEPPTIVRLLHDRIPRSKTCFIVVAVFYYSHIDGCTIGRRKFYIRSTLSQEVRARERIARKIPQIFQISTGYYMRDIAITIANASNAPAQRYFEQFYFERNN